ncbi:alpha/beta hydrolase-fold protein [Williamsia sp.]|uniref:alpha/beta hydrolase n=1 Tax=Williamsia sp. TaxID=1872085 RepID=UPI001A2E300A|nr:alpha/beta hydrolase-fold protein [Williamsia sp.]MBJ7288313.1 alpha/beta hydrolase [Williamsia sp.]
MTSRFNRRALFRAGAGLSALGALAACAGEPATGLPPRQRLQARAQDEVVPESTTSAAVVPGDPALITGSFRSVAMRGRDTRWVVARPPGVTGDIPVVVILHALNSDERTAFDSSLQMHRYLAQSVAGGTAPFALAAVDAARSYFHPRVDGTDSGAMVINEFLPMLTDNRSLGLRTDRIGLYGWSMGGYGALRLGAIMGPSRVAGIAASSPALWGDPRNFPPRAFDNPADYQANSLFGQQAALTKIPLLINIGSSDQFYLYTRQWMAGLHPAAAFSTSPGGHNNRYWRSVLPDQMAFLGRSLAA